MMKKLKISQVQFEAKSLPSENSEKLYKYFKKCLNYKPDIICTPECSNIITSDNNYLHTYSNYQKDCPVLNMTRYFAKKKQNIRKHRLTFIKKTKTKKISK